MIVQERLRFIFLQVSKESSLKKESTVGPQHW